LALGDTVEELQGRISSREFTDWQAYFAIEPHGHHIDEWRWGMLAASICNAVRSTIAVPAGARRPKLFKPSDFYPMQKRADDLTPEQRKYIETKRKRKKRG
jgi:hypothetical protein